MHILDDLLKDVIQAGKSVFSFGRDEKYTDPDSWNTYEKVFSQLRETLDISKTEYFPDGTMIKFKGEVETGRNPRGWETREYVGQLPTTIGDGTLRFVYIVNTHTNEEGFQSTSDRMLINIGEFNIIIQEGSDLIVFAEKGSEYDFVNQQYEKYFPK